MFIAEELGPSRRRWEERDVREFDCGRGEMFIAEGGPRGAVRRSGN